MTHAASYRLLGLPDAAPEDEVRQAYRRIARRLHPDRAGGDAERFKEITAAYNTLTGRQAPGRPSAGPARSARRPAPEQADHAQAWAEWRRRAAGVDLGTAGRDEAGAEPTAEPRPQVEPDAAEPRPAPAEHRTAEVEGGLFQRLKRRLVGDRARVKVPTLAGEDVVLRLPIDAETLLAGGSRKIAITRAAACPCCQDGGDPDCVCAGVGRVKVRETVRVVVPAGARCGARLRLAGKGTAGLCGLPDGDLFLVLDPAKVEGFRREGADLFGVIDVDARLARTGGVLQVRVPRGTVRVTVPAGTVTGRRFRLRGQGLPVWGGQGNGDLFLDVETC